MTIFKAPGSQGGENVHGDLGCDAGETVCEYQRFEGIYCIHLHD